MVTFCKQVVTEAMGLTLPRCWRVRQKRGKPTRGAHTASMKVLLMQNTLQWRRSCDRFSTAWYPSSHPSHHALWLLPYCLHMQQVCAVQGCTNSSMCKTGDTLFWASLACTRDQATCSPAAMEAYRSRTHLLVMVQGVFCGEQPYKVLALCALAIGLCCLGLLRFRVQTDPQHLWVGANSLAAKEKAQYEVCLCLHSSLAPRVAVGVLPAGQCS